MALIESHNKIGITIISTGAAVSVVAILAVALRLWSRRIKNTKLDASDWTCILGLVFGLALLGGTVNTIIQGMGLNVDEVEIPRVVNMLKGMLLGIFLWTLSNTFVRLSILLLYIRIFQQKWFIYFSWAFVVENILFAIALLVAALLICRPLAMFWDPFTVKGTCGNQIAFQEWMGIHNLISDVVVVVMPMPLLWKLKMPIKKKIGLSLIFAMGLGICVITLFRVIETKLVDTQNPTKAYASVGVLSLLEPLLGVINCCLPLISPVIIKVHRHFFPPKGDSTSNSRPVDYTIGGSSRYKRKKRTDPYALDTINNYNTQNSTLITSKGHLDNDSMEFPLKESQNTSGIVVRTQWDVETGTDRTL